MMIVVGWNEILSCKNRDKLFILLQFKRTNVGKILKNNERREYNENELDIFIILGKNTMRLKAI